MRIDISLPPELITRLRKASIDKYGNMRSMSRLIEELTTTGLNADQSPNTGLTPEEIAILDRVDRSPESTETTKAPGTSCCGMWDRFYKCANCGIQFELFYSDHAPTICPHCESRSLKVDKVWDVGGHCKQQNLTFHRSEEKLRCNPWFISGTKFAHKNLRPNEFPWFISVAIAGALGLWGCKPARYELSTHTPTRYKWYENINVLNFVEVKLQKP